VEISPSTFTLLGHYKVEGSIPSALTILFNTLRTQIRATDSRSGDLKFLVAHAHYFKCWSFG
jgi:hypothetical protein